VVVSQATADGGAGARPDALTADAVSAIVARHAGSGSGTAVTGRAVEAADQRSAMRRRRRVIVHAARGRDPP
jgi:hypothetical protein